VAILVSVPALLVAFKLSGLPGSAELADSLSFVSLPTAMQHRTEHLLFTPLGALVVVFVRLTLGIRVLGPFRSVLLAIAFLVTGVAIGVVFFALVMAAVIVLRPVIKSMRMPYFGRSTALLASVASIIILAMLVGQALGFTDVERVAYFPVVVLTLAGDAFAATQRKEGMRSALWRAGATAMVAVLITEIASVRPLASALLRFPELVILCLVGVIFVCEFMSFRLFAHLNPPPKKRKRPRKSAVAASLPPGPPSHASPGVAVPDSAPRPLVSAP
jgi:hypothetical protein